MPQNSPSTCACKLPLNSDTLAEKSQKIENKKQQQAGDSIRDVFIPYVEGHQQSPKGSRFHHPKQVTKWITRNFGPGTKNIASFNGFWTKFWAGNLNRIWCITIPKNAPEIDAMELRIDQWHPTQRHCHPRGTKNRKDSDTLSKFNINPVKFNIKYKLKIAGRSWNSMMDEL